MSTWEITDISKMAKYLRKDIARLRAEPLKKINTLISILEIESIIVRHSKKPKNKKANLRLNLTGLDAIYIDINLWISGVELSRLASSSDLIEAYWDDEQDRMRFLFKNKDKSN